MQHAGARVDQDRLVAAAVGEDAGGLMAAALQIAQHSGRDAGFRLIGLDSDADTVLAAVEKSLPLVIVLGAEGKGLRELTRKNCDVVAKLDFVGAIRSLNVSNAAAIALYALSH